MALSPQMTTTLNRDIILAWFTGKGRERASAALDLLEASVAQGCWVSGASRKVRAALDKPSVATNAARKAIGIGYASPLWRIRHAMWFGNFIGIQAHDIAAARKANPDATIDAFLGLALAWQKDFAQVAQQVEMLDQRQPAPVFTSMGLSPTVTASLVDMGLAGRPETVRVCPHRIDWIHGIDPKTNKPRMFALVILLWPKGTVFGASRYLGTAHNTQCEACGHAIRTARVPLLIDDAKGVPHALWVGRDCARNIFGIKVTGDLDIQK